MSSIFPRARKSQHGYDVEQVEEFLEKARRAYGADTGALTVVTAKSIRHTAFSMQKGGYSTSHVDSALERLEDAFSHRERERSTHGRGEASGGSDARKTTKEILHRLARPPGERFDRVGAFAGGYDANEVDAFADSLTKHFQEGHPMTADDVRLVAFRPRRGGYRETQVDLLLDSVVDVLLILS